MKTPENDKRYPKRPPRLPTLFNNQTPLYFITFNTQKRKPILDNNEIHSAYVEFCGRSPTRGVVVGTYAIMPDHIHMFVWLNRNSCGLGRFIKGMKEYLGKTLDKLATDKPYWQQGFFDHLMRNSDSYSEKSLYVHKNPVRAGLCRNPEDWPYSGTIHNLDWHDNM